PSYVLSHPACPASPPPPTPTPLPYTPLFRSPPPCRRRSGAVPRATRARPHRLARRSGRRNSLATGLSSREIDSGATPGMAESISDRKEHTSELQSLRHLVCRLLLEKKKHINE